MILTEQMYAIEVWANEDDIHPSFMIEDLTLDEVGDFIEEHVHTSAFFVVEPQ